MAFSDKLAILKLRKAMLLYVTGLLLLALGSWASYIYSNQLRHNISSASPIIPAVLLASGAIIVLMGAVYVYESFKIMRGIDKIYTFGRYGDLIQYTGSILIILGVYAILFSSNPSLQHLGPEFTFVGYILSFIGTLPVAISFYNLGKRHDIFLIKIGAVVYFFIPILGPLMLYFGLKEIR